MWGKLPSGGCCVRPLFNLDTPRPVGSGGGSGSCKSSCCVIFLFPFKRLFDWLTAGGCVCSAAIDRSGPVTCLCVRKACGRQEARHQSGQKTDIWPRLQPQGKDITEKKELSILRLREISQSNTLFSQTKKKTKRWQSSKNIHYICCINLSWTFSFT